MGGVAVVFRHGSGGRHILVDTRCGFGLDDPRRPHTALCTHIVHTARHRRRPASVARHTWCIKICQLHNHLRLDILAGVLQSGGVQSVQLDTVGFVHSEQCCADDSADIGN